MKTYSIPCGICRSPYPVLFNPEEWTSFGPRLCMECKKRYKKAIDCGEDRLDWLLSERMKRNDEAT